MRLWDLLLLPFRITISLTTTRLGYFFASCGLRFGLTEILGHAGSYMAALGTFHTELKNGNEVTQFVFFCF